mgnify:CR=1 FL=1
MNDQRNSGRDLEELEGAGRLRRFHGPAVSIGTRLEEPLFDDKTAIAAEVSPWLTARLSAPMPLPAEKRWLVCSSTIQSCSGRPPPAIGTG